MTKKGFSLTKPSTRRIKTKVGIKTIRVKGHANKINRKPRKP